jgi:hypothetical protein
LEQDQAESGIADQDGLLDQTALREKLECACSSPFGRQRLRWSRQLLR